MVDSYRFEHQAFWYGRLGLNQFLHGVRRTVARYLMKIACSAALAIYLLTVLPFSVDNR